MGKSIEQSFNNYISKVEKELGYKITKVQRKMFMYCFVAGAESSIKINDHINIINSIKVTIKSFSTINSLSTWVN